MKKAFDACDKGILLAKLNNYGFRGIVNCWFHSYLSDRKQFTVVNNISSPLREMTCGVPQGSILGPILFLILINDLANSSTLFFALLFADDTTLQISSANINELYEIANRELKIVSEWFKANKLTLNVSKTKYILFRKTTMKVDFSDLTLEIDNCPIDRIGEGCKENSFKFVGIKIDEYLQFKEHIRSVKSKLLSSTFALSKVKNILPECTKLTIYNSLFRSHLEYCNIAWGKSNTKLMTELQSLQKKSLRYVANVKANAHVDPLFLKYKVLNVKDMVDYSSGIFMYKYTNNMIPCSFENFFEKLQNYERSLNFKTTFVKGKRLTSFPSSTLPKYWNSLSLEIKRSCSLITFKTRLTINLQSKYVQSCAKQNCFSCR